MSLTSLEFLLFAILLIVVYFLVPKKGQWIVLLAASLVFYCLGGIKNVIYILITSASTYFATMQLQWIYDSQKQYFKENKATLSKEEKNQIKHKNNSKRKAIMISALVLNFGILCFFKYIHFAIDQINAVIGAFGGNGITDTLDLIIPLGISFYTFQTMGYLVDVYWNKVEAEKCYPKVLLFVSFFPQIIQGPISDYAQLSGQLFSEHSFSYKNYSWGGQRFLWGMFKKMVVANVFAQYVGDVFVNYTHYTGIAAFIGMLAYSVQIYADFSGYMDIVCGLCEMLGIKLTENFERPYFSKSIAEYWRRWHISLGAWFKTYIYYPIAVSKWNNKIGKAAQSKLGKTFGQTVPASIALVAVWLTTGLWHGASWAYIAWGGLNGLFIILSLWLEPVYGRCKAYMKINESKWSWRAFQTLRTFILVSFIKVLPEVGTLSEGIGLWKQIFTSRKLPESFSELLPFVDTSSEMSIFFFAVAVLGVAAMFCFSLLQRSCPVRERFNSLPVVIRTMILAALFVLIAFVGVQSSFGQEDFLYAQF